MTTTDDADVVTCGGCDRDVDTTDDDTVTDCGESWHWDCYAEHARTCADCQAATPYDD